MIVGAGHVIARSDSFRVAIERCRDHYFYERCPERYQVESRETIAKRR